MVKSMVKNIIIVILAVACTVLAVRVWFGSFSFGEIFFSTGGETSSAGTLNWDEAAAARFISSGRLSINGQDFYSNLQQIASWDYAQIALGQLIEGGDFVRFGTSAGFLPTQSVVAISYNFPMSSAFFRDFFGTRAGFLSSHFDYFTSVSIAPVYPDVVEFAFVDDDTYFVFALSAPALYDVFHNMLANDDYDILHSATTAGSVSIRNSVRNMNLVGVRSYVQYLFPGDFEHSVVNEVWTYNDSRRVAHFFPSQVVEFNSIANPSSASDDFISAILLAYALINQNRVTNDVMLAHYFYSEASSRWHFYFDYVTQHAVVNLQELLPSHQGHALEIQVGGGEVLMYRRLMMYFHGGPQ